MKPNKSVKCFHPSNNTLLYLYHSHLDSTDFNQTVSTHINQINCVRILDNNPPWQFHQFSHFSYSKNSPNVFFPSWTIHLLSFFYLDNTIPLLSFSQPGPFPSRKLSRVEKWWEGNCLGWKKWRGQFSRRIFRIPLRSYTIYVIYQEIHFYEHWRYSHYTVLSLHGNNNNVDCKAQGNKSVLSGKSLWLGRQMLTLMTNWLCPCTRVKHPFSYAVFCWLAVCKGKWPIQDLTLGGCNFFSRGY